MKKFALKFVQIAWVSEVIALVLYSMTAVPLLPLDRAELWLRLLPVIGGLIGAQGGAAFAGPLLSDRINKHGGRHE